VFGKLRPALDTLPTADRRLFGSMYCNLCAALGLQYGLKSRLLLVHDLCTIGWLSGETSDLPFVTNNCLQAAVAALEQQLVEQRELEALKEYDLLRISAPTATAYGMALEHAYRIKGTTLTSASTQKVGEVLGRCVYLHDQLADYRRDWGRAFNPLHEVGTEGQRPSALLRRRVQVFIHDQLEQLATETATWPEQLRRRLAAVASRMAALFGISKKSVTLYAVCCVPCGDGAVVVDGKDCDSCMSTAGCCLCLCCVCCPALKGC